MKKLTFQTVMGFFEPHNERIFKMIVEAQKNGTLSPFVGAGLSVPFGYKLWGNVLSELADYLPTEEQKNQALKQIGDHEYEKAAGTIMEEYPYMLDVLPGIVDPDILKNCSDEKKRSSAAWVIPYLFRRELVMTTNFDRVLEECYRAYQNTPIPIITPLNEDRLGQLQLNQELCLLKLHGDIGKEAVSIDDLVFTGEQYDKHYAEDAPLVSVLSQRFSSRRMLFLGCSLTVDRTMEILKKVVATRKGIRHFAILGCKKSEITERSRELQKIGILPIFYDDSNHEAVRVILERLLEETDSKGYQELRRRCRSVSAATDEKRPLMFDSEYIPFSGREVQLEALEEFCKAEEQLLWWAVTGPGGMGKSRLVFEFCKRMEKERWNIERFEASPSRGGNARSLEELTGWMPEVNKTIVVLDDVQAYIEPVREWLVKMGRIRRSEDLRILLLEREGKNLEDASWMGSNFRGTHLEEWCYNEQFLHLKPLTDEQIMAVMSNYAKAAGKNLNAELLLKTLEKVDPNLKRPLYAMAIADARCQDKDPTNWDRKKILDTLLDRELDFHLDRLRGISDRKVKISKTLQAQLEQLLANACINGILPLDNIDWDAYPVLQKKMDEIDMDPEEFCRHIGILRTAHFHAMRVDEQGNPIDDSIQTKEEKVIFLTCPDLLKEHLVLKLAFEKKTIEILPDGWHDNPNRMQFLLRLCIDYPERLKEQSAFWDQFFSVDSVSGLTARFYASLLWGTTEIFPELATKAVGILKRLFTENTDDETIANCYACGLRNLSFNQSIKECAVTVSQLANLHQSYPSWMEISDCYARSLSYLSSLQLLEDCTGTVEQLAVLYHDRSDHTSLAIPYARGLLSLSEKQSPDDRVKTVDQLDKLYHSHSDLMEVAVCYAEGLFNLTQSKTVEDCTTAVKQLKNLYNNHPEQQKIIFCYVGGLAFLSFVQPLEDRPGTVNRLEELYSTHSDLMEVAVVYATVLAVLSCENNLENKTATVERLRSLYNTHPDQREIGIAYAKGLINLCCVTNPENMADVVDRLKTLYNTHSNCEELAVLYAKGLVELALAQTTESEVQVTLEKSEAVLKKHPDDVEIQLSAAKTRFNLTLVQKEEDIPGTVVQICTFLRGHSGIIPEFKEALDKYLSDHPYHTQRYQPLREL